jgi:hypothetical protein
MKRELKVPAAETRRLARIAELSAATRRDWRALERAIRAAFARGIAVRKIAAAAGLPTMTTHTIARTPPGQDGPAVKDAKAPSRVAKPKAGGK